jgi:poly(hydroxyalkanoate) granule-associated protein
MIMLKKAKAEFGSGKVETMKNLSAAIRESPRQIWLAGLGAFAKAQQEGTKVFETLVKQGENVEAKTRTAAAGAADAARGAAQAKAREMQAMAGETWDKLEQVFENRVARALGRLGVYSASDVEKLTERVDELADAVNALLKAQGLTPRRATPVEKMVKGAVQHATRTAARTVSSATSTAARTLSTAGKRAKKTARRAGKLAKAAKAALR